MYNKYLMNLKHMFFIYIYSSSFQMIAASSLWDVNSNHCLMASAGLSLPSQI